MRNYIMMILLAMLSLAIEVKGQEVNFTSPAVERAVRHHLNIDDEAAISFSQLDTITYIDLSRRGVTDTRDLMLMPKLRVLDLSDNMVNDLHPIAMLDSLEYVDLSYNSLKSINELSFSKAENLTVNVAFNYIKDFSMFCSITSCSFTLNGTGLQLSKDAPYFDVYQFYADVSNAGVAKASWRGYTNMENEVSVTCGAVSVKAQMDGYTNSVALPRELDATTQAVLSNGVVGDTTYVVPPLAHIVKGGDVVTIDTELPASYQIGYLRALHGNVEADGKVLHYKAPSNIVADTLYFSYYEAGRIRGFAQMYFMTQDFYDGIEAPMQDAPLKTTLRDGILHIAGTPEELKDVTDVKVYDVTGRTLAAERQADGRGIVVRIPKSPSIVIVEVTLGGRRIVTKVAAR